MMPVAIPELACTLYDGLTPVAQPSVLLWNGSEVHVKTAAVTRSYEAGRLRVSSRSGSADRFISLPDGAQLQCPDHPRLDLFLADDPGEQLWQWLDRRWGVALACLGLLAAGLWFGYERGLAAVAERIAERVPLEYERRLGDSALEWLDAQQLLRPSVLQTDGRAVVQEYFSRLTPGLPRAHAARLDLRSAPSLGPNAFALPGGIIVMTDEMLAMCKSHDEAMVILAHEIGHVERRHALRMVLQSSVAAALASVFAADVSWLGLTLSGLPSQLITASYSRELEAEADEFVFQLSAQRGLQVEAFAVVMERMQKLEGEATSSSSFLASHPATQERIARARSLGSLHGAQLAAPQWKVGDHWSYQALEPEAKGDTLGWMVAREEQVGGVDHYLLVSDDGEHSQHVRRHDLALAVELEGEEVAVRYDPPLQGYTWPLRQQSTWVTASTRSQRGERRPGKLELSCQVDTPGPTSVPVGTFHAMRVMCRDAKTQLLVSERWYAPVVRQWIMERRYADGQLLAAWGLADYSMD